MRARWGLTPRFPPPRQRTATPAQMRRCLSSRRGGEFPGWEPACAWGWVGGLPGGRGLSLGLGALWDP